MARLLLDIITWSAALGFIIFCILYAILASAWHDHMGRHVLVFMGTLAYGIVYGELSRFVSEPYKTYIWIIVMSTISIAVWWRVSIFIHYQIEARKTKKKS